MTLSDKKVLVYDGGGLFVSLALRLAATKAFASVDYFREWEDGFCDGTELTVGSGLEEFGVNRVRHFWPVLNDYGLFVFPDCWNGDLQEYLRSIGKRVWGAGSKGYLEQSRWRTKQLLGKIGLPLNDATQIHGMDNLRAYLKENENVFVKISTYRGMAETFPSPNYVQVKSQLDELEGKYGPIMELIDFIVEKDIPKADEVGYDGYCIDGEFPDNAFYGFEIKNKAYIGKLVDYDELPDDVKQTNTALSYEMDGYRQFWSTELRNKFLIDVTARHASPAGETFCQAFDNLPEILWEGAGGVLVNAESTGKFVAQIILSSPWAETHPLAIQFPEAIRESVKIYNHCRINGVDYCINDDTHAKEIASVVAVGNSLEEVSAQAKKLAEQVAGYQLKANTDALDEAIKEMQDNT
jgi:hypothetical protein